MEVNCQLHGPAILLLGTEPSLASEGRLCGPTAILYIVAKAKAPYTAANQTLLVKPMASHFTDWIITATPSSTSLATTGMIFILFTYAYFKKANNYLYFYQWHYINIKKLYI